MIRKKINKSFFLLCFLNYFSYSTFLIIIIIIIIIDLKRSVMNIRCKSVS